MDPIECGGHEKRIACSRCVRRNFDSEEVYQKELTENDIKESSRLYIKESAARRICPQAFGSPSNQSEHTYNKKDELLLYDAGFNRLPAMVFQRRGNKCYLTGGWGDFVSAKNLSKGHIIRIREYKCKTTGEGFFMIGRVPVGGVLMI
jgi:hypothetical protein